MWPNARQYRLWLSLFGKNSQDLVELKWKFSGKSLEWICVTCLTLPWWVMKKFSMFFFSQFQINRTMCDASAKSFIFWHSNRIHQVSARDNYWRDVTQICGKTKGSATKILLSTENFPRCAIFLFYANTQRRTHCCSFIHSDYNNADVYFIHNWTLAQF